MNGQMQNNDYFKVAAAFRRRFVQIKLFCYFLQRNFPSAEYVWIKRNLLLLLTNVERLQFFFFLLNSPASLQGILRFFLPPFHARLTDPTALKGNKGLNNISFFFAPVITLLLLAVQCFPSGLLIYMIGISYYLRTRYAILFIWKNAASILYVYIADLFPL